MNVSNVKLTSYSHGAGCGCKISPAILSEILSGSYASMDGHLLVGNESKDDAAVIELENGRCLISTTDFFMPIVDDPFDFGRIAAANAISDIYAMGGKPIIAIAILGWPIDKLPAYIAKKVIEGARLICRTVGIQLAGGHSIDSPEPIFGLAVNGIVNKENIKRNNTSLAGDLLFLTKPIGVGILTTAEKKGLLLPADEGIAARQMIELNMIGEKLGQLESVHAMTDVTGFGLLGHVLEMVEANKMEAVLFAEKVRLITETIPYYIKESCIPGGSKRNFSSYGHNVYIDEELDIPLIQTIFSDPQTSGGLLISVDPDGVEEFKSLLIESGLRECTKPIGIIKKGDRGFVSIVP